MKVYGKSDEDKSAENLLMSLIAGEDVQYVMLHARKPINARPCQLPGSLTVQALLVDGRVISVRQNKVGAEPKQV